MSHCLWFAIVGESQHRKGSRDALVTVGSDRPHVEVIGESGPTVVFEAGPWQQFHHLEIGRRPDRSLRPRRALRSRRPRPKFATEGLPRRDYADEVASKLHALLAAADIHPPYILVGHSLGGLYVHMFAKVPEVSGIVLLESFSTEAPSEMKTRAKLLPGTAASRIGFPTGTAYAR